jgi:cytochrome c556
VSGAKLATALATGGLSLAVTGVKKKRPQADWMCLSCHKKFRV